MTESLPKAVLEAADISAISQLVLRERFSRDHGLWEQMRDCFHENSIVRIRAQLPQKVSLGRSENYVRRGKEADPLSVQSHRRPLAA